MHFFMLKTVLECVQFTHVQIREMAKCFQIITISNMDDIRDGVGYSSCAKVTVDSSGYEVRWDGV